VSSDAALPPPYVPAPAQSQLPPPPDVRPYAQHDMELGIGLGLGGYSDAFTLGVSADFAYYVVARLAPGLDIQYQATWGDVEYPQSFTLFPYLKFVLVRSLKFAPYILVGGGRDWEWSGADQSYNRDGSFNGYVAVDSWLFGVGGGMTVMFGGHVGLRLQVLAMYENFDEKVWDPDENEEVEFWWYPAMTLGMVFAF